MGKYCCFFDPQKSFEEKELTDLCPICGRPYNFPMLNYPDIINNGEQTYSVVKSLDRGFYGVTFLCEKKKRFDTENVLLKVIPKALYTFFGKDFESECYKHREVSKNTEHLVQIEDAFETDIVFGKETIACYVAELHYIEGKVLSDFVKHDENVNPLIFAQIVVDLLRIWSELIFKKEYHNDLHLGNIMVEFIEETKQRTEAIYDRIRLVAIDLNSVADESQSNFDKGRIGDQQYLANHIKILTNILRDKYSNLDESIDTDYRLIETFEKIYSILSIQAPYSDVPDIDELIDMIKEELKSDLSYSPWKKVFSLTRMNDGINAQTLSSCHIPILLVDPDENWIKTISISGPQLITGMRGCGKTMLLNALDIHARLFNNNGAQSNEKIVERILNDNYISVIATCRDLIGVADVPEKMIIKLVFLYSIQIIRAARHLHDVAPEKVKKDYHELIAESIETIFDIALPLQARYSPQTLEKHFSLNIKRITSTSGDYSLKMSTVDAFELLADTYIAVSEIFKNKQVFFLLDDASTRYLDVDHISYLLTNVLFLSQKCAFKITTELQTLNFGFRSPGNIEMAHDIRDYQLFDLGADVYERTNDPVKSKKFITEIISKRLRVYNARSYVDPITALGDCSLAQIAKTIIEHKSSRDYKSVYYGVTALTALCVGDIGDIIFLYDSIILSNPPKNSYPISPEIQTKCFQQLCSRRMYNLERRNGILRDFVKEFAEASHKALVDSYSAMTKDGTPSTRIRQYNGLYVRITTGDIQKQRETLRMLIDSGIFVFANGNGWPRTKSNDNDPLVQFKLVFRKLFGLSNLIGLANSDRFELSGESLEQWLNAPSQEILLRNIGRAVDQEKDEPTNNQIEPFDVKSELIEITGNQQQSLFEINETEDVSNEPIKQQHLDMLIEELSNRASVQIFDFSSESKHFDVGIFGLGFEERCYESVKRIIESCTFKKVILIEYPEKGKSKEIKKLLKNFDNKGIDVIYVKYDDYNGVFDYLYEANNILLDITGLYKPIIFDVTRKALIFRKNISIVHTYADKYYPLDSDIEKNIINREEDIATRFNELMKGLLTGEKDGYDIVPLIDSDVTNSIRPSTLIGFVSPKNQRIFSLLDQKEFENVQLLVPNGNTSRDILSQTAGEVAATNYSNICINRLDLRDPQVILKKLFEIYAMQYIDQNSVVELTLTGSKLQAVACAVFSSVCKVSQCWYVKPRSFDVEHFTSGVGKTFVYSIK